MKVLFAGGGTAGHINPAIAIAKAVVDENEANEVLFVGTKKGLEGTLVPQAGFDIKFINVEGLSRKNILRGIVTGSKFLASLVQADHIIRKFKPDYVVGTGGYVSAPVMYMAGLHKIPSLIHEQNVVPGVAVKMAAPFVDVVATSFEDTAPFSQKHKDKCVCVGNPLRPQLLNASAISSRCDLGFDFNPMVLIFGGSLGAGKLNNVLVEYLPLVKDSLQLLIGTGQRYYDDFLYKLKAIDFDLEAYPNIHVVPYIHYMAQAMSTCDIVVSRAGAITISEITALGKASILIPSPNVAHNHQEYNALSLAKNGAAKMIKESELSAQTLDEAIRGLLDDKQALNEMAIKSRELGIRDATEKILDIIVSTVRGKTKDDSVVDNTPETADSQNENN